MRKGIAGIAAKRRTSPTNPVVSLNTFNAQEGTGSTQHVMTNLPANSVLVITTQTATSLANGNVTSTPSLVWTKRADANSNSPSPSGDAEIWWALFTAGGNITVNSVFTSFPQSSVLYVFTGAEQQFGGASSVVTNQRFPSAAITSTRAGSILVCVSSDWNAVDGASRVYRDTSSVETKYFFSFNQTTGYHYYRVAPSISTYTEGLTAPDMTGASVAGGGTCILEIRAAVNQGPDTNPPTAPVLSAGSISASSIGLQWLGSTDDVGVVAYDVYVNNSFNGSTQNTIYTITGLTASTTYSIFVRARDAAGNFTNSNTISPTTSQTGGPRQNLIFEGLFEGASPWNNWLTTQDAGHAWSRTQAAPSIPNPAGGNFAFRAEVRPGCDGCVSSGYRSEVLPNGVNDANNTVMWYGYSLFFETPTAGSLWDGDGNGHFWQWHPNNGTGSAVLAVHNNYISSNGGFTLAVNPSGGRGADHYTESHIAIQANTWYSFVWRVNWASSGGTVKTWINGSLVFNETNLSFNTEGRYLKVGMNRWGTNMTSCSGCSPGSPTVTWVIYFDEVRIGNSNATFNDVAPVQVFPEPS